MISIGANKKGNYGFLFVPDVGKKFPSVKSSQTASGRSDNNVFEELEQLKDDLAKRNRDQDDLLYNLNLGNFTPEIRNRLEEVLNAAKNNNFENDGGTE